MSSQAKSSCVGQDLLGHRHGGVVEGGDAGQQVVRAAELGLEHPPAAHGVAGVRRPARVQAAADAAAVPRRGGCRSPRSRRRGSGTPPRPLPRSRCPPDMPSPSHNSFFSPDVRHCASHGFLWAGVLSVGRLATSLVRTALGACPSGMTGRGPHRNTEALSGSSVPLGFIGSVGHAGVRATADLPAGRPDGPLLALTAVVGRAHELLHVVEHRHARVGGRALVLVGVEGLLGQGVEEGAARRRRGPGTSARCRRRRAAVPPRRRATRRPRRGVAAGRPRVRAMSWKRSGAR